jgi:hypothetical protein
MSNTIIWREMLINIFEQKILKSEKFRRLTMWCEDRYGGGKSDIQLRAEQVYLLRLRANFNDLI